MHTYIRYTLRLGTLRVPVHTIFVKAFIVVCLLAAAVITLDTEW